MAGSWNQVRDWGDCSRLQSEDSRSEPLSSVPRATPRPHWALKSAFPCAFTLIILLEPYSYSVKKPGPYFLHFKDQEAEKLPITFTVIFQTEAKMDWRMCCAHQHNEFMAPWIASSRLSLESAPIRNWGKPLLGQGEIRGEAQQAKHRLEQWNVVEALG